MCFKTRKLDFRPKIRGSAPASSTLKQFLIFKKLTRNTKHGDLSQTADSISRSRGQFCETHNNLRCNSPLMLKKSNAFFSSVMKIHTAKAGQKLPSSFFKLYRQVMLD